MNDINKIKNKGEQLTLMDPFVSTQNYTDVYKILIANSPFSLELQYLREQKGNKREQKA